MLLPSEVCLDVQFWAKDDEEPVLITEGHGTIQAALLKDGILVPTVITAEVPFLGTLTLTADDNDNEMVFYYRQVVVNGTKYTLAVNLYIGG